MLLQSHIKSQHKEYQWYKFLYISRLIKAAVSTSGCSAHNVSVVNEYLIHDKKEAAVTFLCSQSRCLPERTEKISQNSGYQTSLSRFDRQYFQSTGTLKAKPSSISHFLINSKLIGD
jgi:hypothetical protein